MSIFLFVVGIVLFIGLVVVHEFGHFIAARRSGVEAEEFGIFFPPRLYKKKMKGGWLFTINLLPLGGFVRLKGEHDTDTEPGSFGAASIWSKTKIMAAGVVMNLVTAFIIFTALAWLGMPQLVDNQFKIASDTTYLSHAKTSVLIATVEKDSPASKAGLKDNDEVTAVGPVGHTTPVKSADDFPKITQKYAGQTVEIDYKRDNKSFTTTTTLRTAAEVNAAKAQGKQVGYLGLAPEQTQDGITMTRSTWSAPVQAAGVMVQYTALTFQGLGKALAGLGGIFAGAFTHNTPAREAAQTQASSQVNGPVGIFFILKDGSALGYRFMLLIIAIISLTLAIMNILPIPALDGGRLWITLISRAFKHPLSARTEEIVNASGFVVLLALIVVITVVDFKRFL
jgi:regulator of sigma E protease